MLLLKFFQMKSLLVIAIFLFVSCGPSKNATKENGLSVINPKFPVTITYRNSQPPDSLKDYLKSYLQNKGLRIVEYNELFSTWNEKTKSSFMNSSPTTQSRSELQRKMQESFDKIGNILILRINSSIGNSGEYLIETIDWKNLDFPVRDTSAPYQRFDLRKLSFATNSSLLSAFADSILSKKTLQ